ncbi:MAG: tol-pal system protein YbgF [Nitrospirae bacterium]|nr:tol-pal system protein YbgF [Nitrospirota bacterium]
MLGTEQAGTLYRSGEIMITLSKTFVIATLWLWILTSYGCAMQADMVDLENEVRRMKGIVLETQRDVSLLQRPQRPVPQEQTMVQMRESVAKFGGEAKEMVESLQKNQANYEVRFDQMATDVQVIQGRLEENNHRLSEMSEGLDDQGRTVQELSRKVDILEVKTREAQRGQDKILLPGQDVDPGKTGKPVVKTEPQIKLPVALPPPQPEEPAPALPAEGTGVSTAAPSDLYNQAYKEYMLGNYDLAIAGFSDYLRQSPGGNLAPNAVYWIGECYYSKGDYAKAVAAFESVTIDFPKSNKVVGALLKMGYSYEKTGNKETAMAYFKKVIEQFPYSDEARLAKVKLTELH